LDLPTIIRRRWCCESRCFLVLYIWFLGVLCVDRVIYSVLGVGCPKEESWEEEEGKGSRWCES
jgi:hypothetical protein